MWNIIKDSENHKHACGKRYPLEGCGECYDGQYDWTQVTCTGCVFPHWRRRQLFLPALECQCVFCVERNELLMLFSWIRVRARQCGIYGGQSSAGKGLSASTLVLPLSLLLRSTSMFHTYLQRFVLSKGWEIPEQLVTKVGSNKERRYFHCCYCLCLYQKDKRVLPGNFQMLEF